MPATGTDPTTTSPTPTRTAPHPVPTPTPAAAPRAQAAQALDISLRTGSGTGRTLLAAFDHALQCAGVHDFNLVTLSSVIPPRSRIRHVDAPLPGGHGDLLFCVRAEAYAERPGEEVWAGLGWLTDETGGGLFVEHHGHSEAAVLEMIETSLTEMNQRRGGGYRDLRTTLASARCVDQPVCALVLAAYQVTSWFDGATEAAPVAQASEDALVSAPPGGSPGTGSGPGGTHDQVSEAWAADGHVNGHANGHASLNGFADGVVDGLVGMRGGSVESITVERELDYATARRYYPLYRETFGELDTEAVARQLLTEDEFLAEMLDPRVRKYVAWDAEGLAIGITTLTTDVETLPWVNPAYFAARYPEHHARGAVFYCGFTLVHPGHRVARVFHAMMEQITLDVLAERGVIAWDTCRFNDGRGLNGAAGRNLRRLTEFTLEKVDEQSYYVATVHGPRESATRD